MYHRHSETPDSVVLLLYFVALSEGEVHKFGEILLMVEINGLVHANSLQMLSSSNNINNLVS